MTKILIKVFAINLTGIFLLSFSMMNEQNPHSDCNNFYYDSKKKVKRLDSFFQFIDFRKGDTIASIGASNGWFEAAASVHHNNLTFYIEDIDTNCLNQEQLNKVIEFYSKMKGKKIENKFIPVIGEKDKTNLPSDKFDKVLMNMTYHHLEKKQEILTDIGRILKTNGSFFVVEAIIPETQNDQFKCNYYHELEELVNEIESENFKLTNKKEIFPGAGTWVFVFRKQKE